MALLILAMQPVPPAGQAQAYAQSRAKPKPKPEPEINRQMRAFAKDIRRHDEAVAKQRRKPVPVPVQQRTVQGDQVNRAYEAAETPERMIPGEELTTPVKVTNVTQQALPKAGYVLSYHWETRDGRDVTSPANRRETALPKDLAPGGQVTVDGKIEAPDPLFGNQREEFVLKWDLLNRDTRQWLSKSAGVPPLAQDVAVESASSGHLGLEKFYQYAGAATGTGSAVKVNQFTGNVTFGYNAFSNPSRGLATFVRLSYNSMDTSDSIAGPGWAISTSTVQRLGTPLQFYGLASSLFGHPMKIVLVDGDGTSHTFRLNKHDSHDRTKWDYDAPAGLNIQLRKNPDEDDARRWVMARPDRTQIFLDEQGYQTFVRDKNGNELAFGYERTHLGGRNTGMLKTITDAAGRRSLTLDYYRHGDTYTYYADDRRAIGTDLTNPHIVNKLKSITDISGRKMAFSYSDKGLLQEVVDGAGAGAGEGKVYGFFYDRRFLENPKLVRINDPLGHATQLTYFEDTWCKWRLKSLTNRRGKVTTFSYADPDGHDGNQVQATVTDANRHPTTYLIDGYGRPIKITDAKDRATRLAWDADSNVRRLQQNNGAVQTWVYDAKTGYPLEIRDSEANKNNTDPTRLVYRTAQNGHVADLVTKTTPGGRTWEFGHDGKGNLTSVTEPNGTATPARDDHTTTYAYDQHGQLIKAIDANGHATEYGNYGPSGYPGTVTDAQGRGSHTEYDLLGNVITAQNALNKRSTHTYDLFGRSLSSKVPVDQANNRYIFKPAPEYDKNDNVVRHTAPNGAVTLSTYNENGRIVSRELPKDEPEDPRRLVTYQYDGVGNVVRSTQPNGNATPDKPDDYTTTYTYDAIDKVESIRDATGHRATYSHNDVGDLVKVVDPGKNATDDPDDYNTRFEYDLNHRTVKVIDAAGKAVTQKYDVDGFLRETTDQSGNTSHVTYDRNGQQVELRAPWRKKDDGSTEYRVTRFEYDEAGNRTKVVTPRGVQSGDDPKDFTHETVYDELDRVKEKLSPYDPDDGRYNKPSRTQYFYDAVGQVERVSAPPSQGETTRNDTTFGYYDNGWLKGSSDAWGITAGYDYTPLGQQFERTLTSAGGSSQRAMSWTYYPDGKLKTRSDTGAPVGKEVVLADNSDVQNVSAVGDWPASSTSPGHVGPDYRTHAPGSGSDSFTWRLNVPKEGSYEVFVNYAGVKDAAGNARYTVEHREGSDTRKVDQSKDAGTWVSLGRFSFAEGNTNKITLTDEADGTVVADAVKLVRDNSDDPDTESKDFVHRYDPNGNQRLIKDNSPGARVSQYALAYDGMNRVDQIFECRTAEECNAGTAAKTIDYDYDPGGNLKSRTHPDEYAEYTYDTRDQVARVKTGKSAQDPNPQTASYKYTPAGSRLEEVKGNGNTVRYEYHPDGMPRHLTEKKSDETLVSEYTIGYDANGQLARNESKKMSADDHSAYINRTTDYTYDPRDRIRELTQSGTGGSQIERYDHDDNNNVVSQSVGGQSSTFDYDRDRLATSATGGVTASFNYDPYGRLNTVTSAGKVVESYRYDGFDRLVEHGKLGDSGATAKARYSYDPLDRTVAKTVNAGSGQEKTTSFNYLGLSGEVLSEEVGGQISQTYHYAPSADRLSQVKRSPGGNEEVGYYGYNPRTDVETLTDDRGDTRATYGYSAYGNNANAEFTGVDKPDPANPGKGIYNPYRFSAKRWDGATGNYDMGFRQYSPGINRFLSRDSYNGALDDLGMAADPLTNNRYAFGGANPVGNVELDGHGFWSLVKRLFSGKQSSTFLPTTRDPSAETLAYHRAQWQKMETPKRDCNWLCKTKGFVITTNIHTVNFANGYVDGAADSTLDSVAWLMDPTGAVARDCPTCAQATRTLKDANPHIPMGGDTSSTSYKAGHITGEIVGVPIPGLGAMGAGAKTATKAPSVLSKLRGLLSRCGNSFLPGTPVVMADGDRKPIENVRVGDKILATDPATGRTEAKTVTGTITGAGEKSLVRIASGTGKTSGLVIATDNHPFWVAGDVHKWVAAGELKPGMWLRTSAGTYVQITAIALERRAHQRVHNLTVEDLHTYYVLAGPTPVLVHNSGPCPPTKLYRAPHNGVDESRGLDPANFPSVGRHQGTAHFGDSDTVAQQYAGRLDYQEGYHEFTMKPGFLDDFHPSVYRGFHDSGGGRQWIINQEDIELFNTYIDDAIWIPWRRGIELLR